MATSPIVCVVKGDSGIKTLAEYIWDAVLGFTLDTFELRKILHSCNCGDAFVPTGVEKFKPATEVTKGRSFVDDHASDTASIPCRIWLPATLGGSDNTEKHGCYPGENAKGPMIVADVVASFTHAFYQNAIAVIRSLLIENSTDQHIENCRAELTSSPPFLRPTSWNIDRLIPRDRVPLSDRKVELDAGYLAGLNEAERDEITLRLSSAGEVIDEQRRAVH